MMVGKIIFLLFGVFAIVAGIQAEDPFWNIVGVMVGFVCTMVAAQDEEEYDTEKP